MTKIMKGWEFHGTNQPLKFVQRPLPPAQEGHVVVEVKASGLCHTDYAILTDPGWESVMGELPVILGHEVAGIISEVGPGVEGWKVGDRVALSPMPSDKGGDAVGTGADGGYSTHVHVGADKLIPIPEGLDIAQAAAATDAGMTSYAAAVERGKVGPGNKVGVIGVGGLGKVVIQIAVGRGAEVYAATRKPEAQEKALELGAKEVASSIMDFADRDLDVIIDFAGVGQTTYDALEAIGYGGTVVIVGMGKLEATISTKSLILKQAHVIGSNGGTPESIKAVMDLMVEGKVKIDVEKISLDQVPEGLDKLHEGKVNGRMVMIND